MTTTIANFFKESPASLGVFYPTHYIIAAFPKFESSERAAQALRCEGFSSDEVLAIPGSEVLEFFREFRAHSGLAAGVMAMLSRVFGTEQIFADDDVQMARDGAGFVAVFSPTEADEKRIASTIKPYQPIAIHWYRTGGVETIF
jgi:hypothetical protein